DKGDLFRQFVLANEDGLKNAHRLSIREHPEFVHRGSLAFSVLDPVFASRHLRVLHLEFRDPFVGYPSVEPVFADSVKSWTRFWSALQSQVQTVSELSLDLSWGSEDVLDRAEWTRTLQVLKLAHCPSLPKLLNSQLERLQVLKLPSCVVPSGPEGVAFWHTLQRNAPNVHSLWIKSWNLGINDLDNVEIGRAHV